MNNILNAMIEFYNNVTNYILIFILIIMLYILWFYNNYTTKRQMNNIPSAPGKRHWFFGDLFSIINLLEYIKPFGEGTFIAREVRGAFSPSRFFAVPRHMCDPPTQNSCRHDAEDSAQRIRGESPHSPCMCDFSLHREPP